MSGDPDPEEESRTPFPGPAFWSGIERALTASGLGSPRRIFKVRQVRARWEARHASRANLDRGVAYTHKTCPACGRLVERRASACSYCGSNVRWVPGPGLVRALGLSVPHGSVAMTILTLNILLFVLTTIVSARSTGREVLAALFQPDGATLFNLGALHGGAVLGAGQWWRLWTYQFLHGGAFHIFMNAYALFSLAPTTEDVFGPSKMTVLYWVTGVVAGLASMGTRIGMAVLFGGHLFFPIVVGASGAIFGMMGLLIGHTLRRGGSYGRDLRGFLVRWAVYGLIVGLMVPGIDNSAHLGGLAAGFALGLLVHEGEPRGAGAAAWRAAAIAVGIVTIAGYVLAVAAARA